MKSLSERVGRDLSIVYRWRQALLDGRGVSDRNKQALIAATADSVHAIEWNDFAPVDA
jgi:transposase-like protein